MIINYLRDDSKSNVEIGDFIVTQSINGDNLYLIINLSYMNPEYKYGLLNLDTYEIFCNYSGTDHFVEGDSLSEHEQIRYIIKSNEAKLDIKIKE